MIEILIGAGIGFGIFLCAFLGFRQGLRMGMQASKGVAPPAIQHPVQAVREAAAEKEMDALSKQEAEAWKNFLAYNGSAQSLPGGNK